MTALPVALATPASASAGDCTNYLAGQGYSVGSGVRKACLVGSSPGGEVGFGICRTELVDLGVKGDDASSACDLA
ncbi:hypothetical protein [Streptomyces sp. IMTB 2501]|uniref:hypothetical protein n=1 Tax=Streptomyces sp. IMTB 2501 TaxID=1776340 RepID=UPI00117FF349|nr:hypothetical protein [Streptomyces sp. IMTB 2501]